MGIAIVMRLSSHLYTPISTITIKKNNNNKNNDNKTYKNNYSED